MARIAPAVLAAALVETDAWAAGGAEPARGVLATAVRGTLAAFAQQHPGGLVEVRVPPHAAVQVGVGDAGGTHRRGTPPNVVETDAATWLSLWSGRLTWADAVATHRVRVSGAHADLGPLWDTHTAG